MPFDLAFSLDEVTSAAYAIKFGQFAGQEFDWNSMTFKDPR